MSLLSGHKDVSEASTATRDDGERFSRLVAHVSIFLGLCGALWIGWYRFGPKPERNKPALSRQSQTPSSFFGNSRDGHRGDKGGFSGGMRTPQRFSRYIANLATKAGPYTVSIRQVTGDSWQENLYHNLPPETPRNTLEMTVVSIQVFSTDREAVKRIADFTKNLKLTDDHGKRLKFRNASEVIDFEDGSGKACLVQFDPPSEVATRLSRLEGSVALLDPTSEDHGSGSDTSAKTFPFHLSDIPLPVQNHVFGLVSAALIDENSLKGLPLRALPDNQSPASLLLSAESNKLDKLFPEFAPQYAPLKIPSRLILSPDRTSAFTLALHEGEKVHSFRCTLKPHIEHDGEIALTAQIQSLSDSSRSITFKLSAWDDEPLSVLLPAEVLIPSRQGKKIGFRMHLLLDMENVDKDANRARLAPFLAGKGARGGVLSGKVTVGGWPLQQGKVEVEITPVGSTEEQKRSQVALDESGGWRLLNIAPGRYRVQLLEAKPYRSSAAEPGDWNSYVRRRSGITQPVWENARQEIEVRPGSFARLLPANVRNQQ